MRGKALPSLLEGDVTYGHRCSVFWFPPAALVRVCFNSSEVISSMPNCSSLNGTVLQRLLFLLCQVGRNCAGKGMAGCSVTELRVLSP